MIYAPKPEREEEAKRLAALRAKEAPRSDYLRKRGAEKAAIAEWREEQKKLQKQKARRLAMQEKILGIKEKILAPKIPPPAKKPSYVPPDMSWKRDDMRAAGRNTQPKRWVPIFSEKAAKELAQAIPSVPIGTKRIETPVAEFMSPGSMISAGFVTNYDLASNANPNAELSVDSYGAGKSDVSLKPQTFAKINMDERALESSLRIPTGLNFTEGGFKISHGYSISMRAQWNGWNTTAGVDVNYTDVEVSGAGLNGDASQGAYVEVKPLQVTATVVAAAVTVAAFYFLGQPIQQPCFGGVAC